MSSIYRLFYYMLFLAVVNRTAVGQAPAPAPPALPPSTPPPAPTGPPNVTAILEKAGKFSTLLRLMKSTKVGNRLNIELNNTNDAMTIFAPTDAAFSELSFGTLNKLDDRDKINLLQYHILSSYIPIAQFDTITNPVVTEAGSAGPYDYPLNVTTTSNNTVIVSSGIDNTTISDTLYTDGQLAVYQIDKVLLPMGIFGPKPPAPAPAPPKKSSDSTAPLPAVEASGNMGLRENILVAFMGAAVGFLWL
ncbi:fasciclin-like arabinogalactan protein 12 [Cinnamomum micranthum f. kanehirae]|uniref:Fasciclin-like arabinogalactan protein 12 n=1 Tax=Cinnamomum micranthum f. kanehirae TaxID=337451 RepID=A0A443PXU5_9MAGN|nr:fasciclin-like arabinogalactan protein 12 [Cinnamomum micranthum f. kanehirae]